MKSLRNLLDKMKPTFSEGGKLSKLGSVFEGFETFLFVPHTTSKSGTHIHDCVDSKRTMFWVVLALIPALLFGMFNTGYQHYLAIGVDAGFFQTFFWKSVPNNMRSSQPTFCLSFHTSSKSAAVAEISP